MVVQNDRIDPALACMSNRFMIGYTAIDSDDKTDLFGSQAFNCFPVETVTLRNTVRYVVADVFVDLTDKMEKDDDGSDAVSVIITVDNHFFLSTDGAAESVDRFLHILHQERIVEIAEGRGEKASGIVEVDNIATHENP